jgi:hypothetical protein
VTAQVIVYWFTVLELTDETVAVLLWGIVLAMVLVAPTAEVETGDEEKTKLKPIILLDPM